MLHRWETYGGIPYYNYGLVYGKSQFMVIIPCYIWDLPWTKASSVLITERVHLGTPKQLANGFLISPVLCEVNSSGPWPSFNSRQSDILSVPPIDYVGIIVAVRIFDLDHHFYLEWRCSIEEIVKDPETVKTNTIPSIGKTQYSKTTKLAIKLITNLFNNW